MSSVPIPQINESIPQFGESVQEEEGNSRDKKVGANLSIRTQVEMLWHDVDDCGCFGSRRQSRFLGRCQCAREAETEPISANSVVEQEDPHSPPTGILAVGGDKFTVAKSDSACHDSFSCVMVVLGVSNYTYTLSRDGENVKRSYPPD